MSHLILFHHVWVYRSCCHCGQLLNQAAESKKWNSPPQVSPGVMLLQHEHTQVNQKKPIQVVHWDMSLDQYG